MIVLLLVSHTIAGSGQHHKAHGTQKEAAQHDETNIKHKFKIYKNCILTNDLKSILNPSNPLIILEPTLYMHIFFRPNKKISELTMCQSYAHRLSLQWIFLTNFGYCSILYPSTLLPTSPPLPVHSGAIWWHRYRVNIGWGMTCCLTSSSHNLNYFIKAKTKRPPFRRRRFQTNFLEWKCMNFA